jgi:hypothetical protein
MYIVVRFIANNIQEIGNVWTGNTHAGLNLVHKRTLLIEFKRVRSVFLFANIIDIVKKIDFFYFADFPDPRYLYFQGFVSTRIWKQGFLWNPWGEI